ncbi:helix-turn-helix domain-containing protein [Verrucosispora sp. WMMD1129]|uniref:helix-turn-helix transcriptional regulator n=1 Tax=Verrucosispora sp. WMMD1129 TaxID=3016093 RepID=UPI002499B3A6|nr:helix-turn-helix domain-containing protein [Verrucosispora sp. WMMD1129]WFE45012.1 helix-turn-helix domain-containing protein [Verrucosispora sp. WMMD1129]
MSDRRTLATPEEIAAYLQKPVRTLERWRQHGIGPRYSRVGRGVRYRWSDVEKWLDEQAKAAA